MCTCLCLVSSAILCKVSFFPLHLKNILFYFIFNYLFIWLRWVFVAAHRIFSSCSEQGLLFVAACGLLIAVASLAAEHGL